MKIIYQIFIFLLIIKILPINSQEFSFNYFKGCASLTKNQPDSAIYYFEKAIIQDNINIKKIYFYLGQAYYLKNDYIKAIDYFKKSFDSKNYIPYLWIARSYGKQNDKFNTLENLKIYLANENYKIPSYRIKRFDDFKTLINTKEWYDFWSLNWYSKEDLICEEIETLLNRNLFDYAKKILDTLNYKKNKEDLIHYTYANIEFKKGNLPSALSFINEALSKNKTKKEYLEFKMNILFQLSYYKESIELLNQLIKIEPENFEYYLKRAKAFNLIGENVNASKDLYFYLNFFPENMQVSFELARIYNLTNNYIESLKILNNLIKIDPSNYEYYFERGKAYYYSNMLSYAENDFAMVLDINPEIGEAYYFMGMINIKKKNKQVACEFFNKALSKGIKNSVAMIIDYCQ